MNIRRTRLAILLGLFLSLTAAMTAAARPTPAEPIRGTARITDFGGDPLRNHNSAEPWGIPLCASWALDLGKSASQPLSVGDFIYHLAGDSLWKLRKMHSVPPGLTNAEMMDQLVVWRAARLQDNLSLSHPTYVDQDVQLPSGRTTHGVLYVGTGQVPGAGGAPSSLVAVTAEEGTVIRRLLLPAEIVSAPLVIGGTVVFGTTDGFVWAVDNMGDPTKELVKHTAYLGGRVSSSPVPLGQQGFVIGADGVDGRGMVQAYDRDLTPLWVRADGREQPIITAKGVPASFAEIDDRLIFFSDKSGVAYAVNGRDGRIIWTGLIGSREGGAFVNNSPAVDDKSVYFTARTNADTGKGQLVAFARNGRGDLRAPDWVADLPGMGNTAPMSWMPAGAILVGDTAGHISAWRAPSDGETAGRGQPVPFATDLTCRDAGHLKTFWQRIGGSGAEILKSQITLTDNPYRDSIGWSQGSGAGTELSLADGMLLAGANGTDRDVFLAFEHGTPVNLSLTGGLVESGPYQPGQRLHAQYRIVNYSRDARKQMIVHGWTSMEPVYTFVDIPPNADFTVTVETPPVPDSDSSTYLGILNPFFYDFARRGQQEKGLIPLPSAWEPVLYGVTPPAPQVRAGLDALDAVGDAVIYELAAHDNAVQQDVAIKPPVNLIVTGLHAPASIPAPQPPARPEYQVTATVRNDSTRTIETTIRYVVYSTAVQGGQIETTVTLPPGISTHTATMPGSTAGDTIRVVATVNPSHNPAEPDYSDNSASALTKVEDVAAVDPGDYGHVDDVLDH